MSDTYLIDGCQNGHVFVFSSPGSDGKTPEGTLCKCGKTFAHWTRCPTCGHDVLEPRKVDGSDSGLLINIFKEI